MEYKLLPIVINKRDVELLNTGAERERAAIVAWLRERSQNLLRSTSQLERFAGIELKMASDAIKSSQHISREAQSLTTPKDTGL